MRLLAVDPGLRACGCAVFSDGALVAASYVCSTLGRETAAQAVATARAVAAYAQRLCGVVDEVALEWPVVYATRIRRGLAGADPNDLLGLAAVDGAVAALVGAPSVTYAPREWKGQMPHGALEARVRSRLDAGELRVLNDAVAALPASKSHNVVDAVGVGLHQVGRLAPRRAP